MNGGCNLFKKCFLFLPVITEIERYAINGMHHELEEVNREDRLMMVFDRQYYESVKANFSEEGTRHTLCECIDKPEECLLYLLFGHLTFDYHQIKSRPGEWLCGGVRIQMNEAKKDKIRRLLERDAELAANSPEGKKYVPTLSKVHIWELPWEPGSDDSGRGITYHPIANKVFSRLLIQESEGGNGCQTSL